MTFLTIATLMLWSLSPLGSQGVLRILSIRPDDTTTSVDLPFANLDNWAGLPGAGSDGQLFLVAPNTILNAALISPMGIKNGVDDMWGHVKVPLLDNVMANSTQVDGWFPIDQSTNRSFTDYSSLIGVPVGNLPQSTAII